MAITVGTVEIDLRAKMDKLQADVNEGKQTLSRGVQDMQAVASTMAGYFSALGVGAFANYVKGAVDAAGALADLSQKTGVSAETLSGFEYAAKMSGTTIDGIAKGLNKLAVNMYETSNGTGDARNAFAALGISVTDAEGKLKGTDAVMGEIADQFAAMDNGAQKTALAVKLFGKSGVELVPLLNEGSAGIQKMRDRAEELGLVISDETASAMEALGDKFDTVGMASQGTARQLAADLTPALTSVADLFLDSTHKGGFLTTAMGLLGDSIRGLISIGYGAAAVFEPLGTAIGALLAASAAGLTGNFDGGLEILRQNEADVAASSERWAGKIKEVWSAQTKAQDDAGVSLKNVTEIRKADADAADKQAKKIQDVKDKLDQELAALGMTATQAAIYKAHISAGVDANSAAGKSIAEKVIALEAEKEKLKLAKESQEAYNKAIKDHDEALIKETTSVRERLEKAEQEFEQMGLSKSAIEELTLSRMREKLLLIESRIDAEGLTEARAKELAAIQEQIELQGSLINVLKKGEVREAQQKNADAALKTWQETAKSIEQALTDSLMRGFDSGKDLVTSLRDYIGNAFKSMVVKMAVQPVMGMITGAMGLISGNSAMAAAGTAQQASGVSNIMTTLSTISTMAGAFGSSLAAGFTSTIASFGATTGLAIEGGMASIATGTATSIASGLGQIVGALGPYALAAVAIYGLLGGFKGTYIKGKSLDSTYDAEGKRTGRSVRDWFNVSDGGQEFDDFLGGIANTYQQIAKGLGIRRGSLGLGFETNDSEGGKFGFSANLNGRNVLTVGETKITDGAIELTASRAVFAALQASEMPRHLAGIFDGMVASAMTQDQLNAAIRTASAYQALHTTLISLPLANLRDLSYQAASGLVAAAGGMDTLIKGLQSYYDLYYSADEKNVISATSISSALAAVGLDGSKLSTRDDFRALFESVDASTSVGQQQIAALLQVAPTFATLADYLTEQEKSLGDLSTITPQLATLTAVTGTATAATVTAADATASAIAATTSAVEAGTTAVVGAVSGLASTVADAVNSASRASTDAISRLERRFGDLESRNSLIDAAP